MDLLVGDIVQMRKTHPCGSQTWRVIRVGADVKIRCQGCGRIVMLERGEFEKRVKKILQRNIPQPETDALEAFRSFSGTLDGTALYHEPENPSGEVR